MTLYGYSPEREEQEIEYQSRQNYPQEAFGSEVEGGCPICGLAQSCLECVEFRERMEELAVDLEPIGGVEGLPW